MHLLSKVGTWNTFLYVNILWVADMNIVCVCVWEFVVFSHSTLYQTSNTIPTLVVGGAIESQHCALQFCHQTPEPPISTGLQTQDMHVQLWRLGRNRIFHTDFDFDLSCFSCINVSALFGCQFTVVNLSIFLLLWRVNKWLEEVKHSLINTTNLEQSDDSCLDCGVHNYIDVCGLKLY